MDKEDFEKISEEMIEQCEENIRQLEEIIEKHTKKTKKIYKH